MTIKPHSQVEGAQGLVVAASLLGAVAASSCCILPLVLFALGVSGAWIGYFTRLAPYQPYFIAGTFVCLGAGYWLAGRHRFVFRGRSVRAAAAAPHCHGRVRRRYGPRHRGARLRLACAPLSRLMNGEHLMTKLFAVVAFIILPAPAAFAGDQTITLAVQNMYCAACPHTVKTSLEPVPGVGKATVSYKDKTAVVTYDDTRPMWPR
jgi:mercuric transport protein